MGRAPGRDASGANEVVPALGAPTVEIPAGLRGGMRVQIIELIQLRIERREQTLDQRPQRHVIGLGAIAILGARTNRAHHVLAVEVVDRDPPDFAKALRFLQRTDGGPAWLEDPPEAKGHGAGLVYVGARIVTSVQWSSPCCAPLHAAAGYKAWARPAIGDAALNL